MAVESVSTPEDWYNSPPGVDSNGCRTMRGHSDCATALLAKWESYKREMETRTAQYYKLVRIAAAEVMTPKKDLANVSSGEASGMVLRMARNLVQHTPNIEVRSIFDDDDAAGALAEYMLRTHIIGDDSYSNDMQQNLFASTKNALTLGFDTVIPVLKQRADRTWFIEYDNVFYRDVFPEPGAKDIRKANDVFIRRYLTKGDVKRLIRDQPTGWDVPALKTLLKSAPRPRQEVDAESKRHHAIPEGYEIITWYSSSGEHFLTFNPNDERQLLRIEKNKHPLKEHPVMFLVLEKDLNQPLGKSQLERILGRQDFQDLLLNFAMKQYYRNLNPTIIGYGVPDGALNMSPGKYNPIGNPNARIEAFEVNTQTLMMVGTISQQNAGAMVQQTGAADQQMATQSSAGAMSQTPQGVEAQQAMVDITTNNYQKAIESFFSRYCSYALTLYFAELKNTEKVTVSAHTRKLLIDRGFPEEDIDPTTGELNVDMKNMARLYHVLAVPGTLVEMEDEKELRILNQLFVPLSQAMPAIAATQDAAIMRKMAAAMEYIVEKQLQMSGGMHRDAVTQLLEEGPSDAFTLSQQRIDALESSLASVNESYLEQIQIMSDTIEQQQKQLSVLTQLQEAMGAQSGGMQAPPSEAVAL